MNENKGGPRLVVATRLVLETQLLIVVLSVAAGTIYKATIKIND